MESMDPVVGRLDTRAVCNRCSMKGLGCNGHLFETLAKGGRCLIVLLSNCDEITVELGAGASHLIPKICKY